MICRICDSENLEPAIDLGMQPWANNFLAPADVGTEPAYPLRVVFCHDCCTAQLDFTVKKEVMFRDHTYLSGVTRSLSDHFATIAQGVDERFFKQADRKSVLDIGSNDGTQLKHFQKLGYDAVGVESSARTARIANESGVPTINAFFNLETARQIGRSFQVINAAGVFFHLEELHSVAEAIRHSLADDGVFVVQFLYMKQIIRNRAFDQIYHEHLLYYNVATLERLLSRHGLHLFDAWLSPIHGGSIIAYVSKHSRMPRSGRLDALLAAEENEQSNSFATYRRFAVDIAELRELNLAWLAERKREQKRIFGFGAPVKGNTLLNYFKIGTETLDCLVERNPLRRGLYSPGMHIPLLLEDELVAPPDVYYVLAWNFKEEILERNRNLLDQGVEFYFPIDPVIDS